MKIPNLHEFWEDFLFLQSDGNENCNTVMALNTANLMHWGAFVFSEPDGR